MSQSQAWAIRALHELQVPANGLKPWTGCFITLTYDDEHLPSDHSVDVSEWQHFTARTRKALGPFRFLHCGEYGDDNGRPHYHACIFGLDFRDDRYHWKLSNGHPLFRSPTLEKLWTKGQSYIGELTYESAAYVARYTLKKVTGVSADEYYGTRKPPYMTMSRRPGLGAAWFEKFKSDVFPDDFVVLNGKKARVPTYYDTLLERHQPELLEQLRQKRKERVEELAEDLTEERLREKEIYQRARIKLLKREL